MSARCRRSGSEEFSSSRLRGRTGKRQGLRTALKIIRICHTASNLSNGLVIGQRLRVNRVVKYDRTHTSTSRQPLPSVSIQRYVRTSIASSWICGEHLWRMHEEHYEKTEFQYFLEINEFLSIFKCWSSSANTTLVTLATRSVLLHISIFALGARFRTYVSIWIISGKPGDMHPGVIGCISGRKYPGLESNPEISSV